MVRHDSTAPWEGVASESDRFTTRFSEDEGGPAAALVRAVAAVTDRQPRAMRPLSDAVDPDALNRLLARGDGDTVVSFTYEGCLVYLTGDERLAVVAE